jgi:hypothetical protein
MTRAVQARVAEARAGLAWSVLAPLKQRGLFRLGFMLLVLGLLAISCRPLLLLILPGMLVVYLPWWRQRFLSDLIVFVVGTSIAFWIVTFWFLPYGKIPLSSWAYGVVALATLVMGIGLWKHPERARIVVDRDDIFAVLLLVSAVALRWSFGWRWPLTPAGADTSMHSYLAALIAAGNTVPTTHLPLLPVDNFGAYPVGFQALIALMSMLSGIPIYRGAMFMEVSTLAFLTLAFYGFVRVFWDRPSSAMVALLVTFLPRNPQHFVQWGGDPTLLSLGLLVTALALCPWLKEQMSPGMWGFSALFVTASIFTHLIPVIGLCYAMLPVAVYVAIDRVLSPRQALQRIVGNLLAIGLVSGLLAGVCLPALLSAEVSAGEIEWVRQFQQRGSGGAWGGTLGDAIVTIPPYLTEKIFGLPFVVLSMLGLFVLAYRRPRLVLVSGICVVTIIGLVINSMYWVLPLSYAMYPERVALLLLLPCAVGIGALLDGVRRLVPGRGMLLWGMAAVTLFVAVRHNEKLFRKGILPNTLVSEADLKAMHWLAETTAPGTVVQNYYGDAGLWIPAVAFRPVTDPHLNPFIFDEFRNASSELKARFVYVGKRKLLGEPISIDQFEAAPNRYRKVYDQGGVMIYEVIDHAANRGGLGQGLAECWCWEGCRLRHSIPGFGGIRPHIVTDNLLSPGDSMQDQRQSRELRKSSSL